MEYLAWLVQEPLPLPLRHQAESLWYRLHRFILQFLDQLPVLWISLEIHVPPLPHPGLYLHRIQHLPRYHP